jgi:hypothetical protein
MTPLEAETKAIDTKSMLTADTVTADGKASLAGFWPGIDYQVSLIPNGVKGTYTIVDKMGQKPISWRVTDPDIVFESYHQPPSYVDVKSEKMERIAVPYTYILDILTYDFSKVPVGVTVE